MAKFVQCGCRSICQIASKRREWMFNWPVYSETRTMELISLLRVWNVMKLGVTNLILPPNGWAWSGGIPNPLVQKADSAEKAGKVLLGLFFDDKGPLLIKWLQYRATVNAEMYCNELHTLVKLNQAIKNNLRGNLSKEIVLLKDNARLTCWQQDPSAP